MNPTHIRLTRELSADLDTPLSAFLRAANQPRSFIFESMHGGERWGRYSFIGLPAREWVVVRGHEVSAWHDGVCVERRREHRPMDWVRRHCGAVRVAANPALPRFTGGWVGYLAYDAARFFEPTIGITEPGADDLPDLLWMRADEVLVFDSLRATLTLVVHARVDDAEDLARAQGRIDAIEAALATPPDFAGRKLPNATPSVAFDSSFSRTSYLAAVERAQEYIAAGDSFQIQLGQRLSTAFDADPVALYRAIRRLNPSPYLFCLDLDDHHVIGSSPEILVRLADGEVTLRPIAGTRPRGATPEHDRALEAELRADPKEVAEHVMLIDLGRNDVGRVCEPGVRVTDQMVVERYSHVMHLVSQVTGRLKPGLDAFDVLAATFPAGTLTGAPKVRTMEIIAELEPTRRGVYGGAVGYLGFDGNMDFAIAIRTAVIHGGQVHVQASAGIVADSQPNAEWEETLHKARAMCRAVEQALASAVSPRP